MKNTTIAKKMYYCALNYFDACEKLKKDLLHDNNPSIIYPLLYLERHTLELLLKAIILLNVKPQNIVEDLKIEIDSGKFFDLSRTHSLLILINKYIEINTTNSLFPNYEEKAINQIKKQLEKFNRIDSKSDFYRYPISKDKKQSKLKIWDKFDSDSLININFKNTYVMCNQDNEILYILKNIDIQSLKYLNILHNNCFYFLEQLSKMVK
jgi:hypothetical protein